MEIFWKFTQRNSENTKVFSSGISKIFTNYEIWNNFLIRYRKFTITTSSISLGSHIGYQYMIDWITGTDDIMDDFFKMFIIVLVEDDICLIVLLISLIKTRMFTDVYEPRKVGWISCLFCTGRFIIPMNRKRENIHVVEKFFCKALSSKHRSIGTDVYGISELLGKLKKGKKFWKQSGFSSGKVYIVKAFFCSIH